MSTTLTTVVQQPSGKQQTTVEDIAVRLDDLDVNCDEQSAPEARPRTVPLRISATCSIFRWNPPPMTVEEQAMIDLMLRVKNEMDWHLKVFHEQFIREWRWENLRRTGKFGPRDSAILDHCIEELRENAISYSRSGYTEAIDATACVYMSDTVVPYNTRKLLEQSVWALERIEYDKQPDWRPGSDDAIITLVDPSLFPLIHGRSHVLLNRKVALRTRPASCGEDHLIPARMPGYTCPHSSRKLPLAQKLRRDGASYDEFQWLPCNVLFNRHKQARITSYINNLHPVGNEQLYQAIEGVITAVAPMWLQTILSTQFLMTNRINTEDDKDDGGEDDSSEDDSFEDDDTPEEDIEVDSIDAVRSCHQQPVFPTLTGFKPRRRGARILRRLGAYPGLDGERLISLPDQQRFPNTHDSQNVMIERWQRIFFEQGLQVIVELANFHLTPDKPTYHGGSWNCGGLMNEHIRATAFYCYNSENTTDPYLEVREHVEEESVLWQDERYEGKVQFCAESSRWGRRDRQTLGRIPMRDGRLVVVPSVLPSRFSRFTLQDRSRLGYRKMLILYLVAPDIRVISTANVPPQQKEWWTKDQEENRALLQKLSKELADQVVEDVHPCPNTLTLEEAKIIRERMLEKSMTIDGEQSSSYGYKSL